MTSDYDELGEFHDLFMEARWQRLRPTLEVAFGSLGPDDTVVDVGAGTGIGTRLLAAATLARIVAIEPSLTMRAVLIARVADDPRLAERVSVLAEAAPAALARVRGPIAGFVCAHMLGHLAPDARAALFADLAARLTPSGHGVATFDRIPATADDGRAMADAVEERRIGDHHYLVRYLPGRAPGESRSVYEVHAGDALLRRAVFASSWTPVDLDALRAELAPHGLRADDHGGVALIGRAIRDATTADPHDGA